MSSSARYTVDDFPVVIPDLKNMPIPRTDGRNNKNRRPPQESVWVRFLKNRNVGDKFQVSYSTHIAIKQIAKKMGITLVWENIGPVPGMGYEYRVNVWVYSIPGIRGRSMDLIVVDDPIVE